MREKINIKNVEHKVKGNNINPKMKLIVITIILIIFFISLYFFIKSDYKNQNFGNNMSNKNIEEIEEYILNISSFEAKIEVNIESNKNKNRYLLSQKYTKPNISKQTVIEPSNIAGIETIYDGENLTIHNSKLNLSSIFENYEYIVDNFLWLNSFIDDYKEGKSNQRTSLEEKDGVIIMETRTKNEDKQYVYNKKLYIDRNTGKPTKLIVQDINKKNLVYILYNEITVNGLQREEILAFKIMDVYQELL